jgi:hypothetical protein
VRRALEQQAPPERSRRLADRARDEPVVVEPAEVHAARRLLSPRAVVEARHERVDQRAEAVAPDGRHRRRSSRSTRAAA